MVKYRYLKIFRILRREIVFYKIIDGEKRLEGVIGLY